MDKYERKTKTLYKRDNNIFYCNDNFYEYRKLI